MDARTIRWLVFLALIKNFTCDFTLEKTRRTATEGSCIEIKCKGTSYASVDKAYWYWMKDAVYNKKTEKFNATIVYSSNVSMRPVSPNFANRVNFTGSLSSSRIHYPSSENLCNILICDLNRTDSGNYQFRFEEIPESKNKWVTKPGVQLTVEENTCLITFEKPAPVKENDEIRLTCSTLSSCSSRLKMEPLSQTSTITPRNAENGETITYSFVTSREDDGRVFSCQTQNNEDQHLIRKISITVEYAPINIQAIMNPANVKEGDFVTFTCSADGQPAPTFTWFKDDQQQSSEAKWIIPSIKDTDKGSYFCKATNKHSTQRSNTVDVDVQYPPDVYIKTSEWPQSSRRDIKEGEGITFTCAVRRSNPEHCTFSWFKDRTLVSRGNTYVIIEAEPSHTGNYTCKAHNAVGVGESALFELKVHYRPRKTRVSPQGDTNVKVHTRLTFTCDTDAYPRPLIYSWYRYMETNPSQLTPMMGQQSLKLNKVQRADEACYRCNTTNDVGPGDISKPVCIKVLFAPNITTFSMDPEVREGLPIRILCAAESYPSSRLTLNKSSTATSPEWSVLLPTSGSYTFTAAPADAGLYSCTASNSEGSAHSTPRRLRVKYSPRDVKVDSQPGLVVRENASLTLNCTAHSYPSVTSVTWMKITDGQTESIQNTTFYVKSVSPADSGRYSCSATNIIGAEKSPEVKVKVEYGPKHTKIIKGEEKQGPDGTGVVILSCSSHCYPPIKQYVWYKKTGDQRGDVELSSDQNITVHSHQQGEYYCVAKNDIGQRSSESIRPFDDKIRRAVKYFFLFCLILLILFLILFLYRRRRNKSNQQRTTNTQPCCGFLGWSGARRRNLTNGTGLAEPFRSRDDLLPEQPCRPMAQRCQPRPDSTPASNINSVYCTVNLPKGKQAASAQQPQTQHGGHVVEESLNYASLHFDNKQKKPQVDAVYAMVSKPKASKEKTQGRLEDYENVSAARAAKPQYSYDSDSDTSEDEVEVNYSQVNFKPKPGHQRAKRDSSNSEDETQYSEVKI